MKTANTTATTTIQNIAKANDARAIANINKVDPEFAKQLALLAVGKIKSVSMTPAQSKVAAAAYRPTKTSKKAIATSKSNKVSAVPVGNGVSADPLNINEPKANETYSKLRVALAANDPKLTATQLDKLVAGYAEQDIALYGKTKWMAKSGQLEAAHIVKATKANKFTAKNMLPKASDSKPAATKASKDSKAAPVAKATSKRTSAPADETKVVATKAAAAAKAGSFYALLAVLAAKPITMAALVAKLVVKLKGSLRSEQDVAVIAKVRVRDSYTRLGMLQAAK